MGEKAPNNKGFFMGPLWSFYVAIKTYVFGFYWLFIQIISPHKKLKEIPKRSRETAIVTGGSGGIGLQVVKQLLQADMKVIMACRDTTAGNKMIRKIRQSGVTSGQAECMHLELGSIHSVKKFAKNFTGTSLSILVNNAATACCPYKQTIDGFETQFQVNYLSHFLLTILLIPPLIRGGTESKCSRIVNVSSIISRIADIDMDDLLMRNYYDRFNAYAASKLLQVISSNYLNQRFISEKLPIRTYSVHPGVVRTNFFRHFPFPLSKLMIALLFFIGNSPKRGSDGVVFAALSDKLQGVGGIMLSNCGVIASPVEAEDASIQRKLWEMSCKFSKLQLSRENLSLVPDSFLIINIE